MNDELGELDFADVGTFERVPDGPGSYRYEPERSGQHYDMQVALRNGQLVRCRLGNVRFTVRACSDYGVLEITDVVLT